MSYNQTTKKLESSVIWNVRVTYTFVRDYTVIQCPILTIHVHIISLRACRELYITRIHGDIIQFFAKTCTGYVLRELHTVDL